MLRRGMPRARISAEYRGWWRILETSQWVDDGLDDLGTALLSIGQRGDRARSLEPAERAVEGLRVGPNPTEGERLVEAETWLAKRRAP
jgi:hypothetical protein